ncbi:MAG: signal peptide peptidase SppA [Propionibacteriales bacterium]|nr:signal peptide peptidase SppA [Propionibacteriales bacterium]
MTTPTTTRTANVTSRLRALSGDRVPIPGQPHDDLLLELDLVRGVAEAPPSSPIEAVRNRNLPLLRQVVDGLRRAAEDPHVHGLIAHVGEPQPTLAQACELRQAVEDFRRSGKPAVCWSETYGEFGPGNVSYFLATAFDEVWMLPSGDVGLTGVVASAMFLRGALDKLGVVPELAQRHEYKSAADRLMRDHMTEAHKEMAARLAESAMDTIASAVAESRGLADDQVRAAIEQAPLSAEAAVEAGLVDHLGYRDEVYDAVRSRLGDVKLRYVERYAKHASRAAFTAVTQRKRPTVAVIQASGPIFLTRPRSAGPWSGPSVTGDGMGALLRAAGRDDTIRAVVLRVDSGGGSYLGSDVIRREVLQLKKGGKPVVASMATLAGSGGYYISMPADVVVATAGTLTGSIGVLAGKQVTTDALNKVGIRRESVSIGAHAEMFSSERGFTDEEWQRLERWLDRVYSDFTGKVAIDRSLPLEHVQEVAKGRVWTGSDAREHRLVDEIGGLDDAIEIACKRAGLVRADVQVRRLPRTALLERLRPAESSEHPAAAEARVAGPVDLLSAAYAVLGLPAYGVLTMPLDLRMR